MSNPLEPLLRAIGQLDDPVFISVVLRSVAWAAGCFVGVLVVVLWGIHHVLPTQSLAAGWAGWLVWLLDLLGTVGAALLAFWLFLPVAAAIGTLFIERIAQAVEGRCYPGLKPARGAPLSAQLWDAAVLGLQVLLLTGAALVLAIVLPGIGALLGWAISGWALGRGLFVAVAMRRMGRDEAAALHRSRRFTVLAVGAVLAMAGFLPPLNLLVPVLGVAAMVHVLHQASR